MRVVMVAGYARCLFVVCSLLLFVCSSKRMLLFVAQSHVVYEPMRREGMRMFDPVAAPLHAKM
jgi:hypothetical protein